MRNLLLFFILLLLAASCHKTQPQRFAALNMSDYPVNTGDSWAYQVWDSVTNVTDTTVFIVTSKTVVNTDTTIFNYQATVSGSIVDSGTITQSLTAYAYYSSTGNSIFQSLRLIHSYTMTTRCMQGCYFSGRYGVWNCGFKQLYGTGQRVF